jgi:hypothetical protein
MWPMKLNAMPAVQCCRRIFGDVTSLGGDPAPSARPGLAEYLLERPKGSPRDYLARPSTTHLGVRPLERLGCRAGTPKG